MMVPRLRLRPLFLESKKRASAFLADRENCDFCWRVNVAVTVVIMISMVALIIWLVQAVEKSPDINNKTDWLDNKHISSLQSLAIIAGGIFGIPFFVWRVCIANRQAKSSQRQAMVARDRLIEDTKGDRNRLIANRYERALELFGHSDISVKLGAVFALESVARDSSDHRWPVVETLTAWIRSRFRRNDMTFGDERIPSFVDLLESAPENVGSDALLSAIVSMLRTRIAPGVAAQTQKVNLYNVDLLEVNLSGAPLKRADLHDSNLQRADLSGAELQGAVLDRACFRHASLRKAKLICASLDGADCKHANLQRVWGYRCRAPNASFRKAFLQRAILRRLVAPGSDFTKARLRAAKLGGANLAGADFTKANLRGANLENSDLRDVIFPKAEAWGADFSGANLTGASLADANLRGAKLHGATLKRTRLEGANLQEAEGLSTPQLDAAIGDNTTLLPEGVSRPESWS